MDGGRLGLAETIAALRAELAQAVEAASDADIRFQVGQVQLEFHVGVTRQGGGSAGVRFWVVELGGDASYAREEVQTVTVTLESAVDRAGEPVRVTRRRLEKP